MISTLVLVGAFLVSNWLTGWVRSYAVRSGILDRPNHRSSHTVPTPRGGGAAILLAVLLGFLIASLLGRIREVDALVIGTGMAVLGLVGWLDDRGGLSQSVRLFAQIVVAAIAVEGFGGLHVLRFGEHAIRIGAVGTGLGVVGVVWSTNLFNFMDGIDGIAGLQATLTFGAAAWLLALRGDTQLALAAGIIGAASLGFTRWNWPPAKIFMGDVGSGALGYGMAVVAIAAERDGRVPLIAFAILNAVFIADATVTLCRRILRRQLPWQAHREHAYQRLAVSLGRHDPVTIGSGVLTTVLAGVAAAISFNPQLSMLSLFTALALVAVPLLIVERRAPFVQTSDSKRTRTKR